jgi:hypothetical protein
MKEKPTRVLLPGDPTMEEIIGMYKMLTGREPSPEEMEEAAKELRGDSPERERTS